MEIAEKLLREEIRKILEGSFVDDREEIIYDFEAGRAFGNNKLSKSIKGLEGYYLADYFPNSEMKETWMYELDNPYGGTNLIEIIHHLGDDYEGYWKMNLAEVPPGSNQTQVVKIVDSIKGIDNFVRFVNSNLESYINPEFL